MTATFMKILIFVVVLKSTNGFNIMESVQRFRNTSIARSLSLDDRDEIRFIAIGDWGSGMDKNHI